jgi:non-heme chloroperoxidase
MGEAIARYQPGRRTPPNLGNLARNARLGDDGKYYWHWDPRTRSAPRDLPQRQARYEACARRLALPTLLIRGAMSTLVSEEAAQSFLALCPACEYVSVSGAGHTLTGDRNDAFCAAILEFLRRVAPP